MIDVFTGVLLPFLSGGLGGLLVAGLIVGRRLRQISTVYYDCTSCDHGLGYHQDRKQCTFDPHPTWSSTTVCRCQVYVGEVPPPTLEELTRDA